jgi:hypothetical protein
MATRKTKTDTPPAKSRASSTPVQRRSERRTAPPMDAASTAVSMPSSAPDATAGRLLREAAWSRMFGRIESKNPFAR